jgi:hypothetical protein
MNSTLRAHFDGEQICLDDPFPMQPGTSLTVTVWQKEPTDEEETFDFLSGSVLADASAKEPDYSLELIKEPNPDYEGSRSRSGPPSPDR